ncbi:hypothetical protein D3C79_916860 [compost metagenome]
MTNIKLISHCPKISKKPKTFSGLDMPEIIKPNENKLPNIKAKIFFIGLPQHMTNDINS